MSTDSAFPSGDGNRYTFSRGMTIEDYFAAHAISAVIASCVNDDKSPDITMPEFFALKAYEIADALSKERTRRLGQVTPDYTTSELI